MASARGPRTKPHWVALDGLRGVAILMVLVFHVGLPFTVHIAWGVFGVELFFVLSGFLITALLLREWESTGELSFKRFFSRRALRLVPALLAAVVVTLIFGALLAPHASDRHASLWGSISSTFYVSDFSSAFHYHNFSNPLSHTWSLGIEEQFYLVWPLVAYAVLKKRGKRAALILASSLVVIGTLERLVLFASGAGFNRLYFAPDARAAGLMLGCALALALDLRPDLLRAWRGRLAAAGATFLAISILMRQSPSLLAWWLPVASIASAGLILGAVDGAPLLIRRTLTSRSLVTLGRVSYGLYLWHLVVIVIVHFYLPSIPRVIRVGLEVTLFSAATALSWHYIERPALRLKRRFEAPMLPSAGV